VKHHRMMLSPYLHGCLAADDEWRSVHARITDGERRRTLCTSPLLAKSVLCTPDMSAASRLSTARACPQSAAWPATECGPHTPTPPKRCFDLARIARPGVKELRTGARSGCALEGGHSGTTPPCSAWRAGAQARARGQTCSLSQAASERPAVTHTLPRSLHVASGRVPGAHRRPAERGCSHAAGRQEQAYARSVLLL
jgi:hypothetical protein